MRIRFVAVAATGALVLGTGAAQGAATLGIFTVAGNGGEGFTGDGKSATTARLDGPAGLLALPDGSIVVADTINQRIRRVDAATQTIRTIAGTGKRGFSGDGGPATRAELQDPTALARGRDGSIFVADTGNNRIRMIGPDGTIATIAGTADQGFSGDGGPSTRAQINAPSGLAVDGSGQLFFSDTGNERVRVIHVDGTIATVAGSGQRGAGGDGGPSTAAQLNTPAGLAIAADGSLLIADSGNNRIRRVAPSGTIETVAGTGGGGSGGDGGPATAAQLNLPVDVSAPLQGGFFIAEQGGNRIRHVDPKGNIGRLTGSGGPRFGGDGRPASLGLVNAPRAVELMPSGLELLIADTDNNRIRYVAIPGQASLLALAMLKTSITAPLAKVKQKKRRILVVRDVRLGFRVTKESDLTLRIETKRGHLVRTLETHVGPGTGAVHLPRALRRGKRRLTKDHYVVGVTAVAGKATARTSMELVVR